MEDHLSKLSKQLERLGFYDRANSVKIISESFKPNAEERLLQKRKMELTRKFWTIMKSYITKEFEMLRELQERGDLDNEAYYQSATYRACNKFSNHQLHMDLFLDWLEGSDDPNRTPFFRYFDREQAGLLAKLRHGLRSNPSSNIYNLCNTRDVDSNLPKEPKQNNIILEKA